MKQILKIIIGKINKLFFIFNKSILIKSSSFLFVRISITHQNITRLKNTKLEKVRIFVNGENNEINVTNSLISKSSFSISGTNNKVVLKDNVKLRGATINIRGNNCTLIIGNGTSTGGVRIVNIGVNNKIEIGENCLFADYIEIWASDTHTILNENNERINKEKHIFIKDRVWIGSHATILKGVTIGADSIIGMGTIVTKDVPNNSISAGFPNRVIKNNVHWKLDYIIK